MMANTVEDPNNDPNLYSEIDVSSCTPFTSIEEPFRKRVYLPNPFSDKIIIEICLVTNTSSFMTS